MRTPLLLSLLLLWVSPAFADVPSFDGFVTDRAGLLHASQKRTLESLMESYRQGTTHEIAVLIVKSLEGRPIEWYAFDRAKRALPPEEVYQSNTDNLGDIILVTATRGVHQAPIYPMFDFATIFDGEMPFRRIE